LFEIRYLSAVIVADSFLMALSLYVFMNRPTHLEMIYKKGLYPNY